MQKDSGMSRRRIPPELRRRTWVEETVWELLVVAELLPYRFVSPLADLGMTPRERRELRREEELLKGTNIAYILPQPASPRRKSQPWLYVRTKRGGYFRIGEAGEVERFGRRTQHLGSGSITEHRWYPCSLRGVRWLQVISSGRLVQKVTKDQARDQTMAFAADCVSDEQPTRATAVVPAEQLRLFP
jgi:hypothetical protein